MMPKRHPARINAGHTCEKKRRSKPNNGPVNGVAIKRNENNDGHYH
jgi:hypothetical protein